jgi:hypothetical protein
MNRSDDVRPDDARDVLRAVWDARGQTGATLDSAGLDPDCSPTKVCKNMKGVTFDGFAEPGSDLGQAWRDKLAREGKLGESSLRDLVLGPSE